MMIIEEEVFFVQLGYFIIIKAYLLYLLLLNQMQNELIRIEKYKSVFV